MRNLRQFEIVREIARQGSISKAAETLCVSQPTVSKFLQNLETDLQLELFDRSVIPIRLTRAGERYLAAANRILDVHRQMEKELDELRSRRSGILTVGISPSRAPFILPDLMAAYRQLHPQGKVVIREQPMHQLHDNLLRGDLDMILSLRTEETLGFAEEPLFTETVLLAAPAHMEGLCVPDILKKHPVITIGSGLWMWNVTKQLLESLGGNTPAIECQSIESALALVKKGLGATLVPSYITKDRPDRVLFLPLPEEMQAQFRGELRRKVCLFYRHNAFLTQAEQCFIEACRQMKQDFLLSQKSFRKEV